MNLVIIDDIRKIYHPFIYAGNDVELFIRENVNAINRKNHTFLRVEMGVAIDELKEKGFTMDQGMHERMVFDYNAHLQPEEKPLLLWKRELG